MHHIDPEDGAELLGATSATSGVPSDFLATNFLAARPVGEVAGEGSSSGESEVDNSDQNEEPGSLICPFMLRQGEVIPNSEVGVQSPDKRGQALIIRWLACPHKPCLPCQPLPSPSAHADGMIRVWVRQDEDDEEEGDEEEDAEDEDAGSEAEGRMSPGCGVIWEDEDEDELAKTRVTINVRTRGRSWRDGEEDAFADDSFGSATKGF